MKKLEYFLKIIRTSIISDKNYLTKKFMRKIKYTPNFDFPTSFNEKINHRILYDRNPLFTQLADKLLVRDFIKQKIGEDYLVPLLKTYTKTQQIRLDELPEQFVLKCNHDSGSSIICHSKRHFDLSKATKKLDFYLMRNFYYITREKHYKDINAKIICEKYIDLFSNNNRMLTPETCRIHCFNGAPHYSEIDFSDENGNEFINIYDPEWNLQSVTLGYPNMRHKLPQPTLYSKMLELAKILAEGFDYCRVDFLISETKIYFSELTFTPNAGRTPIEPISWDYKLGSLWQQKIYTAN
ncbi:glycosyltransferase [Moellerella wisconsensis]|uniref:ATP-grasp fold amidoligase family protein n=1 Tax=Moellerella wisconsensis TaxID=158849 RepID=UPI001F4D3F7F|nr:ATP-grasp fold amidoligase family protein [Moellerella wisconsensis]UNH26414.1 glycosyltransferase [Moellerella wisconsensis]